MSSRATRLSCSATEGVPGADPAGRSMFVVSTRRAARRVLSLSWALDRRSSPEEERESHSSRRRLSAFRRAGDRWRAIMAFTAVNRCESAPGNS